MPVNGAQGMYGGQGVGGVGLSCVRVSCARVCAGIIQCYDMNLQMYDRRCSSGRLALREEAGAVRVEEMT